MLISTACSTAQTAACMSVVLAYSLAHGLDSTKTTTLRVMDLTTSRLSEDLYP